MPGVRCIAGVRCVPRVCCARTPRGARSAPDAQPLPVPASSTVGAYKLLLSTDGAPAGAAPRRACARAARIRTQRTASACGGLAGGFARRARPCDIEGRTAAGGAHGGFELVGLLGPPGGEALVRVVDPEPQRQRLVAARHGASGGLSRNRASGGLFGCRSAPGPVAVSGGSRYKQEASPRGGPRADPALREHTPPAAAQLSRDR